MVTPIHTSAGVPSPSAANAPVLVVRSLTKSYGKRRVLRGVSFDLESGQLVGIVGENGAGKSTLLRILVGVLRADAGTIQSRNRLGYCPQEHTLFDALTVAENLTYFARAYGLDTADPAYRAWRGELLQRLAFAQYELVRVAHLSAGTRQKLNLALALLHRPDLLVLDEPYAGFDWETYLRFWDLAADLKRDGATLLVVSHLVFDRERFDRIYHLQEGILNPV